MIFLNFQGITTDYFGQIQTCLLRSDQFWTFLPKKVIFRTKVWKTWTIWEHWEGTKIWVVILTFSRHYRLFWSNSDFLLKIRPILEFLPQKVRFRTKVWDNLTIWEHLGRYRDLSGNFDLFKTLQTNSSFIQFYREKIDQNVLIEQDMLKTTISRDVEWKIRPFSDLFSSKSQILNKNPRNSDQLGILGRDLDFSGIS